MATAFCNATRPSRSSAAIGCSNISRSNSSSSRKTSRSADGIGAVGVDHQRELVAEVLPDGADELDVLPGPDLDLDPPIALVQMCLDRLEQLDDRRIEPERQARLDPPVQLVDRRPEHLGDRRVPCLAEQVPAGGLRPRDREPAAPGQVAARSAISSTAPNARPIRPGAIRIGQVVPAPLGRVARVAEPGGHRRALAQADPAACLDGHQDRILDGDLAPRDPQRLLQRDLEMSQRDTLHRAGHDDTSASEPSGLHMPIINRPDAARQARRRIVPGGERGTTRPPQPAVLVPQLSNFHRLGAESGCRAAVDLLDWPRGRAPAGRPNSGSCDEPNRVRFALVS